MAQLLDKQWQAWIGENLRRNCALDDMLSAMQSAGIKEEKARFNISAYQAAGIDKALSIVEFQQESSHLFQHENNLLTLDGQVIKVSMRLSTPDIVLLDNFMTHAECDEVCEYAKNSLTKSTVIDDVTGIGISHEHRSSQGTHFTLGQNALVQKLEARICEITGMPVVNGEGIQILSYAHGGEYRPHFDYFADSEGGRANMVQGGQRIITIIMYLSDVAAGGATIFPEINLSIYPKKGSALYFSYFNSLQQVDSRTLHGGAPVISGEKWIATKWIREREYS